VTFEKTSDVIENLFLSLRSWEHLFFQQIPIRFPLVWFRRSSRPQRATKHSRSHKRKRQEFDVINFYLIE
jgi:hypothetical protein